MTNQAHEAIDGELKIRRATAGDRLALERLAGRDSRPVLTGRVLLAESLGGELIAATSLDEGAGIADPFHSSADALDLLRLRAVQIAGAGATPEADSRGRGRGVRIFAGLVRGTGSVPLGGS